MMKDGAYKDQKVNFMLLNGMIPVLVAEEDINSTDWFLKYNVTSLPTTFILDENGNVIERLEGFKSVESIRTLLDRYSRVKTVNSNLNNVPIVFKPKSKIRKYIPTPFPRREKKKSSTPVVVENEVNDTYRSEETKRYPTIYGIQLNSFNSIYDATEYHEYINKFFSKETIILTSDDEKVYKIIFTCKSLKDAKRQIKDFDLVELNCFIRVL